MSNVLFSGGLQDWKRFLLQEDDGELGYIYAFFFSNGVAKVGASKKPKDRLGNLLQTFHRSGYEGEVERVVLSVPTVDYIQQEKALHKRLPQEGRLFEYFRVNHDQYLDIIEGIHLKTGYSTDELAARAESSARAEVLMNAIFIDPLRAALERKTQMEEFSFGPKAGAALLLLARALQQSSLDPEEKMLEFSEQLIDELPDSQQQQDVAAIFCAVSYAIGHGFRDYAASLSASS